MLTLDKLNSILERVLLEARKRWVNAWVERIKVCKGKFIILMVVGESRVKVIVYRGSIKVRVYSRLKGLSISLQRIYEREYRRVVDREKREER